MSDINVTVTNAGTSSVAVSGGSTISPTVGNGGSVTVTTGTISPGNATVVSGTLAIGKVTTLAAGSQATVVNSGTAYAAVIDIGLPTGATGAAGKDGITPAFSIGTVTTGAAGSSATVKANTTDGGSKVSLDFTIPKGDTGATGSSGVTLSSSAPSALGTAAAGTSVEASRADHVHALPTAKDLGLAAVATSGSYADLTGTPSAYSLPTASASTLGGIKVGANLTITDGVLAATGGSNLSLSDALPLPLGTAAAGDDTQAARADHSHPMPTAADVGALDVDATVDGGDYVGVIIAPGGSITISSQPASQTVTAGGVNEVQSTLPAGTWRSVSYVDGKWFVMGNNSASADYYAVSSDGGVSWTKRYGLPLAGNWSPMQYQNGVYATNAGHTTAYSSDGLAWSAYTSTSGFATSAVLGAGGKFLRFANGGISYSTDAANWTKSLDWSGTGTPYFGYAGSTYFASISSTAIRASSDGVTWGSALALGSSTGVWPQAYGNFLTPVDFGGSLYFSRQNNAPLKYTSGTWGGVTNPTGTGGGQVASNGSVLVLYSYTGAIYSSTNGSTWVQRLTGLGSQNTFTLFYAGGRFVLLYRYGSGVSTPGTAYYTSTDGIDWTAATRTYGTANDTSAATVSGSTHASHQNGVFSAITFGGTTASATFGVVATYTSPLSYQWQLSTDGGSTWSNVTDATASTLVLTGLTSADSGKKYRCVLSATGTTSVNTNAATLTVN